MQQYAQEYHYLLPQYTRLQEPGAFRVVFAIRPPVTADAVADTAAAAGLPVHGGGSCSSSSSSSNETWQGSANQNELTAEQLAVSYRQVLNVKELLQWCNAWQPTAATAADLVGMNNTGAAGGGAKQYTHAVCVAHEFGRHGKVDVAPASSSSSDNSIGRWLKVGAARLRRLLARSRPAGRAAESAQARANVQMAYVQQQQQQRQQWPGGDSELDPRALMTDLATLDHAGE
jgi:hypothetical protein